MNKITNIELQNSTEYFTALFVSNDSKVYDVVFSRNVERNIGWEGIDLLSIQNRGQNVEDEVLWKEITEHLSDVLSEQMDDGIKKFCIEVGMENLSVLDSLAKLVLADSQSTPEGALEAAIFSQIQQQLGMR